MSELLVHKIVRQLFKLKSCPKLYSRLASSSVEKGRQLESLNTNGNNIHGSKKDISKGPSLEHFIANTVSPYVLDNKVKKDEAAVPFIKDDDLLGLGRKVYFDVYGCQMNVSDTEIAWAVLQDKGFVRTSDITQGLLLF
ncbi:CK5P1-like protein [Mya arenaria]|uniref:CK5P1-like protein n=1 Tax=Mya arenaria TaxID=6604 RepID=A0ABY7EC47_MYAAR|nr:CK5P1-like protein [Mya arenaria]